MFAGCDDRRVGREQLTTEVQRLVPDLPEPRFAFGAARGPRPGVEAVALIPALIVEIWLISVLHISWVVGMLGLLVAFWTPMLLLRSTWTIAGNDRFVVLIRNKRFRPSRPDRLSKRLMAPTAIAFVEGGDRAVELAGIRYWVAGAHSDEARRAAGLTQNPPPL